MGKFISKLKANIEESIIIGIESKSSKNSIGPIIFGMLQPGEYFADSDELFDKDKTEVFVQSSDGSSSPAFGQFYSWVESSSRVKIVSMNQNDEVVPADFRNLTFKIKT